MAINFNSLNNCVINIYNQQSQNLSDPLITEKIKDVFLELSNKKINNVNCEVLELHFNDSKSYQAEKIEFNFFSRNELSENNSPFDFYVEKLISNNPKLVADVYPLNGTARSRFIKKNLFRVYDSIALNKTIERLNNLHINSNNVFVLDIKDRDQKYNNLDEIKEAELEVSEFFQENEPSEKSPRKSFYQSIKEKHVDYFLCEGSLKAELIKNVFSSKQSEFFQENPEGKAAFCQICEIIMNAFKSSKSAQVVSHSGTSFNFNPEKFFLPTYVIHEDEGKRSKIKEISHLDDTSLITLYPDHYKNIYSATSRYFTTIAKAFDAKHDFDSKTGVTTISLHSLQNL